MFGSKIGVHTLIYLEPLSFGLSNGQKVKGQGQVLFLDIAVLLLLLRNGKRLLITCNGENVKLIKSYICYIGSKIIGPTVLGLRSKMKVFCVYLKNRNS